ncbi:DUF6887 family protein [Scytonema millei]|uniref:Uncharacterized protein n=1 Tax=Scytonema millei VB511283 TaxID=1245923 RepID=A0A9X5E8T4_9CYAN|nr:hypothetical protein [Scytonema millei]NHC36903.1 hypothetical protein [Scytonema millei VB511283]
MNKPDFGSLNRTELKRYVLEHRDDLEAMREFFVNRSDPNGKVYPFTLDEEGQREGFEALRRKVEQLQQEEQN